MELIMVNKENYKQAITIQNSIFPHANGTLNILASLDRELFIKRTGIGYIDDHVKYYLAKKNDNYVGITGIYYYNYDETSAWIAWYGILEPFRNHHLGKELLQKTMELAAEKNFKYIRLYTDYIENGEAIKLYENEGFIEEKYIAEKLDYDCRIYSKSLIDTDVPLWNNKNLSLSHQSELDQMTEDKILKILNMYNNLFFPDIIKDDIEI